MSGHDAQHWNRRVASLAGPIVLSNLSVPLVGAVDTATVGHLSDPVYIGAVALGAVIFSFLFWGFGFLRMSTSGLVAQSLGRGDSNEVRAILCRALLTALAAGALLVVAQWPLGQGALALTDAQGRLSEETYRYFEIRVWGAPAALANYAVLGCLIGLQKTGAALIHQLALNLTNMILDVILVFGFQLQTAGVAAASVAAEVVAAAVGMALIARHLPQPFAVSSSQLLAREKLRALLIVNTNIAIRTLCLTTAFFYFAAVGTRLGESVLAANAVLLHLQTFLAYGLDGFAHAAETLAGNAYGARHAEAFRAAVRASTRLAVLVAVAYTVLYALGGRLLVNLLTDIDEVRGMAYTYLPWLVAAPLLSVWSFQLDGIFIGTTRSREMRNAMLLSLGGFVVLSVPLVQYQGNHGLWAALMLFMILRALSLGFYYPALRRAAADPDRI
ncbi:MAG: MATE family efflux transporter [Gammaproteobacteria bacterium]|nr:MATE family efflux transporter [Gammaproteobacteria bacterium]